MIRESNSMSFLQYPRVFIGVKENFDITSATHGQVFSTPVSYQFPIGESWVVATGERENGQKVLACKMVSVIGRKAPVINADLCTGELINVHVNDSSLSNTFKVNWGDGNTEELAKTGLTSTFSHKYSDFYKEIKVNSFYSHNNQKFCYSDTARLFRDIPESVFLSSLEGLTDPTEVFIRYHGDSTTVFEIMGMIDQNNTENWEQMSMGEAGNATIIGLDPQIKYCFKTRTTNNCGEYFYSENTLCTLVLDRDIESSTSMNVHWNVPLYPKQAPSKFELRRRLAGTTTPTLTETFANPLQTSFLDKNLVCGQPYFYQVEARYPAISFKGRPIEVMIRTSFIAKEIGDAKVDEKPPFFAAAGFDALNPQKLGLHILVTPDQITQIDQFHVYKSKSLNGDYNLVSESKANSYSEDGLALGVGKHCFKYQISDVCGVKSGLSDPFCAVNLLDVKRDTLAWNSYYAPKNLLDQGSQPLYYIEYLDPVSGTFEKMESLYADSLFWMGDFMKDWNYPELQIRILANQNVIFDNGFIFPVNLYSNTVIYRPAPSVYAPSAFSPDGTGPAETETFVPITRFMESGSFTVRDRYGNVLFQSNDLTHAWDGMDQKSGKQVGVGTYFYVISGKGTNGSVISVRGSISLFR